MWYIKCFYPFVNNFNVFNFWSYLLQIRQKGNFWVREAMQICYHFQHFWLQNLRFWEVLIKKLRFLATQEKVSIKTTKASVQHGFHCVPFGHNESLTVSCSALFFSYKFNLIFLHLSNMSLSMLSKKVYILINVNFAQIVYRHCCFVKHSFSVSQFVKIV